MVLYVMQTLNTDNATSTTGSTTSLLYYNPMGIRSSLDIRQSNDVGVLNSSRSRWFNKWKWKTIHSGAFIITLNGNNCSIGDWPVVKTLESAKSSW